MRRSLFASQPAAHELAEWSPCSPQKSPFHVSRLRLRKLPPTARPRRARSNSLPKDFRLKLSGHKLRERAQKTRD